MSRRADNLEYSVEAKIGFEAALQEIEHQADHWDTPEHRATGHLIAEALRSSVSIARDGGVQCHHREWRCTFVGRAGGQAHARFGSIEEARQFAERNAHAMGFDGDWVEADGYLVLSTVVGNYLLTRA
jgi:hypothetical protein